MSSHSPQPQSGRSTRRHAYRSFWLLVVVAVLAVGVLTRALGASPSPLTGLRVAVSGLIALGSITLSVRVMIAVERAQQRARRI